MKHKIDKTAQSPLCRICDKKSELISHIVSECEKLAPKEYIQEKARCYKNSSLEIVWEIQPEKK